MDRDAAAQGVQPGGSWAGLGEARGDTKGSDGAGHPQTPLAKQP